MTRKEVDKTIDHAQRAAEWTIISMIAVAALVVIAAAAVLA